MSRLWETIRARMRREQPDVPFDQSLTVSYVALTGVGFTFKFQCFRFNLFPPQTIERFMFDYAICFFYNNLIIKYILLAHLGSNDLLMFDNDCFNSNLCLQNTF